MAVPWLERTTGGESSARRGHITKAPPVGSRSSLAVPRRWRCCPRRRRLVWRPCSLASLLARVPAAAAASIRSVFLAIQGLKAGPVSSVSLNSSPQRCAWSSPFRLPSHPCPLQPCTRSSSGLHPRCSCVFRVPSFLRPCPLLTWLQEPCRLGPTSSLHSRSVYLPACPVKLFPLGQVSVGAGLAAAAPISSGAVFP